MNKDILFRPLCWLMGLITTLKTGAIFQGYTYSGHDFVDLEEHENCKVIISKCEDCGKKDFSWIK